MNDMADIDKGLSFVKQGTLKEGTSVLAEKEMFVEVGSVQTQKAGNEVCGDVFLSHKISEENRTIVILSDGLGSGIKANVLATMTASMAMNFIKVNSPVEHTARIIMMTLPVDRFRKISFSSFTILDIMGNRQVKMIEYGNPPVLIVRKNSLIETEKTEVAVVGSRVKQKIFVSTYKAEKNDRIILFSDGITQSGIGNADMPFGWERENAARWITETISGQETISAAALSGKILARALRNDAFTARDDCSCGVVYFREPRKILFCSGPPYRSDNDKYLAGRVRDYKGKVIISGGTTAQIVARELKREIITRIDKDLNGLPPDSEMEGVDLVTEGILTIGKVSGYLENLAQLKDDIPGPAGKIIALFNGNDEIEFLVGTRVNEAHQDPNLPVELEIRRNVIKKIARLLADKFLKKVSIMYV